VAWTNLVAALACGALALYLLTQSRKLADDEADLMHAAAWYRPIRRWSHRAGGLLVAAVAIALLIGGIK
jgi:hypothetical protein